MGPESFRDYLSSNGFDPRDFRTASEIFIDSKRDLGRTLRENQTMALRAGSAPDGTGTQFALVRVEGGLDDFFINEQQFDQRIDDRLDLRSGSSDYAELSQQTRDMLLAYDMLPRYSKSSFLHLAMSTGILSRALDLDVDSIGAAPVTISSSFDFEFRPHAAVEQVITHNRGQVEVDASFVSRRHGERVLVVLEAKQGRPRMVAKHKLFYPLLGIGATAASKFASVIPVYLRATTADDTLQYHMCECEPMAIQDQVATLSDITVRSQTNVEVQL